MISKRQQRDKTFIRKIIWKNTTCREIVQNLCLCLFVGEIPIASNAQSHFKCGNVASKRNRSERVEQIRFFFNTSLSEGSTKPSHGMFSREAILDFSPVLFYLNLGASLHGANV